MVDPTPRAARAAFCKGTNKQNYTLLILPHPSCFHLHRQDSLTPGFWKNNLYSTSCLPLAQAWQNAERVPVDHPQSSARGGRASPGRWGAMHPLPAPAGGTVFSHISNLCSIITFQGKKKKKTPNCLD